MNYLWKNSKRVIVYEKKVPAWSSLDGWFWYHIDIKKNRIWCRQLRNVVNFSHATQKPQRLPPLGFSCINENYDRYKKRSCMEFHTASWPVRESNPGLRRERASSWPLDQQAGIEATRFELATSASRTQRSTKLSHASMFLSVCFALFTSDLYIIAWPWKKCKRFFEKISIFWKKVFSANLPGSRKTSQSLIL